MDLAALHPLVVLQSSSGVTSLPILRQLLKSATSRTLIFCFLYPPSVLVECDKLDKFSIYDYLYRVPGYSDAWTETKKHIESAVRALPKDPLNVVVDSVDCLMSDYKTTSETYRFLHDILLLVSTSEQSCHLILHVSSPETVPLLLQPSFSPAMSHIIVHPPILLKEIATSLSTPLPTDNNDIRFWNVFLAIAERKFDLDNLIFGPKGDGEGNSKEIVVQLISRPGPRRQKGVERTLQGWKIPDETMCSLLQLASLNSLHKAYPLSSVNPAQNLSFNLALTESQQVSKATVPLPYVHDGNPTSSTIFYDPDSADDIDDDDPDEDLDI